MERPLTAAADDVRRLIAQSVLGAHDPPPLRIGQITLRPHQMLALDRLRRAFDDGGGALLADAVGLGKTYVALALATDARRALVVAPAALRPMWGAALARSGVRTEVLSFERLSRCGASGVPDAGCYDLVIVDEAHHARNPTTRRYGALAALTRKARVLLLSATPVHNRRDDLCALMALFLGERAWSLDDAALARFIVRREQTAVVAARPPVISAPQRIVVADDSERLEEILALPAPLPSADGGDAGALLLFSLVRQWASSQGALRRALERRLAQAVALGSALAAGRYPDRSELRLWAFADGAVQLAFPELLPAASGSCADLLAAVRQHERAVRALLERIGAGRDQDATRADRLTELAERHPDEKVVAFTQFADTVDALFAHLRSRPAVAALTARGAMVAGGALTRAEAIRRFAPYATGERPPHASERIDLLLTTDLLSEGVNLQDASVVVHLDLPWTPARLEQRVGRVARLGSRHRRIAVFAFIPPASIELVLGVERRLQAKLAAARRTVGISGTILPSLATLSASSEAAAPRAEERVRQLLARWRDAPRAERRRAREVGVPAPLLPSPAEAVSTGLAPLVAAVRATEGGFVALLEVRGRPYLVASSGATPSDDPTIVARLAGEAGGDDVPADDVAIRDALQLLERWASHRAAASAASLDLAASVRARRAVIARIAGIVARAPPHSRSSVATMASAARQAALIPAGAGAERVLAELADAPMSDDAWLRAVRTFGDLHARSPSDAGPSPSPSPSPSEARLLALLVLRPVSG